MIFCRKLFVAPYRKKIVEEFFSVSLISGIENVLQKRGLF